jgi:hypothetical protein
MHGSAGAVVATAFGTGMENQLDPIEFEPLSQSSVSSTLPVGVSTMTLDTRGDNSAQRASTVADWLVV